MNQWNELAQATSMSLKHPMPVPAVPVVIDGTKLVMQTTCQFDDKNITYCYRLLIYVNRPTGSTAW
jgi:hypothetical protein